MPRTDSSLSDQLPRLDNQLCFALYSASLATTKLYKPLLQPWGLTYPQYLVMLALWENDDCMVSELGERLFLDSGTLTPLLKRMESAGWLQRQRDSADERRVRIVLTAAGRELREKLAGIPECMLQQSPCTLSELQALRLQLQQWRDHLVTLIPPASH
ncbi:MarR family winged helix-turn-helix transcriptional regulator [Comamonas antarctica]|uniref:MarR family transcriptional regulator n=1 Tax=Comamonas antarctica TaxID=2743470 RepID=A0A6N1X1F0_9BURK|nr:MarR family transcriptional regulator [Comamonas antarctica]QKV53077.1 MarR family transcriptional regulator [Comamonas antarctica]